LSESHIHRIVNRRLRTDISQDSYEFRHLPPLDGAMPKVPGKHS
jgi:hypothetical protein